MRFILMQGLYIRQAKVRSIHHSGQFILIKLLKQHTEKKKTTDNIIRLILKS